jgi:hypothetical protein
LRHNLWRLPIPKAGESDKTPTMEGRVLEPPLLGSQSPSVGWRELSSMIGREGILITQREKLRVRVRVVDVRMAYGRRDLLVEPVAGSGPPVWVSAQRVKLRA